MMMLQGHFVDTMLDDKYRDSSSLIYWTWHFMRGMTAPIFFFVSGAIFVFLMLRDVRPGTKHPHPKGFAEGGIAAIFGLRAQMEFFLRFQFQIFPFLLFCRRFSHHWPGDFDGHRGVYCLPKNPHPHP
ncbi:MAG: hypothetical protein IPO07_26190 [Haliscomenobacter sp.]|nr:hypothetical protein [Haliscomenobacter sp.]